MGKALLTIKSRVLGAIRQEYEYAIPAEDDEALLRLCRGTIIEKTRHNVVCAGRTWTVDVFGGHRAGLILAECELQHADEEVVLPDWFGEKLTDDPAYRNEAL